MRCSFEKHSFFIDGEETQILSGAIHYFRTFPEQWEDRLKKLKNCGFNTVETYLAWHLHEETENNWDFSGRLDFVRFIRLAQKLGLWVIVRPGPYICSECDLGGLPGWLLGKPGIRLRCFNEIYLHYVQLYMTRVLALLNVLQYTCGGPVIAMQLENEYGGYGDDCDYLRSLQKMIRNAGIDVPLFTSDGAGEAALKNGSLPDVPATVNYRNHPGKNMEALHRINTGYENPYFTAELWVGKAWHWGEIPLHHAEEDVAEDMHEILRNRWNVNCYMFHGGTNFGFTSGANFEGEYRPLLTSYEVDAMLEESGRITGKYEAVRRVMQEYGRPTEEPEKDPEITVPASFSLTQEVSLHDSLDALSTPKTLPLPETMEHFGQSFGFILYSRCMKKHDGGRWKLCGMKDRAVVLLDGKLQCVVIREEPFITLTVPEDGMLLEILVENTGRVNYGCEMERECKGLVSVNNGSRQLMGWQIRNLPLNDLAELQFGSLTRTAGPHFYRGVFHCEKSTDLFLRLPDGVHGCVWCNQFNVGRYWKCGPQETLYLPSPLIRPGENEIIVFDTGGLVSPVLSFAPGRIIAPMSRLIL